MKTSTQGKIELACHEGLSQMPYYDSVHVITIGIGFTISEIPDLPHWPLTRSMSIPDIFAMFGTALEKYEDAVNECLTIDIVQQQFDALVSLCYNIGTSGLKHSSLVEAITNYASDDEIRRHFMMWDKPSAIISRRTDEANLYITCEYQTDGKCDLIETGGVGKERYGKTINLHDYIN